MYCCSAFFDFVNGLYTFYAASTRRWGILTVALTVNGCNYTLKQLSDTRWSACSDAIIVLNKGYVVIKNVTKQISTDQTQTETCRQQAKGIYDTMCKLETGLMVLLWSKILDRFQKTSECLQYADLDLNRACAYYDSLKHYVQTLRGNIITEIEDKAKELTGCQLYQEESGRRRKRNTKYDDYCGSNTPDPVYESLSASQKFELEVVNVIIDKLVSALTDRTNAYKKVCSVFGPIHDLQISSDDQIRNMSLNIVKTYPEDLENSLAEEFVQFSYLLKTPEYASQIITKKGEAGAEVSLELQYYRILHENMMQLMFPNIEIALRIYLSMMVTNCSGERSFSKLSLIKDRLRNSIGQEKLNYLTLMSIEYKVLREMDTDTIIDKFAHIKSRKKRLL